MKLLSRAGSFAVSTAAGLGRPGQLGSERERPEPPGLGVPGGLRSVLQLNLAGRGGGRPAAWGREGPGSRARARRGRDQTPGNPREGAG